MRLSSVSIYPGQYVAASKEKDMMRELRQVKKEEIFHPIADISESRNSYKIEMDIPGMKREEILVNVSNEVVSVRAAHSSFRISGGHFPHQDLITKGVKCNIPLPLNADPEFATAEYKEGKLLLHFKKMSGPARIKSSKIIVY